MSEDSNIDDYNMEHIAQELTRFCTEYVSLSNEIDNKKKEIKDLTSRHKELSTKISSLMRTSELDEVNCGKQHKIVLQERKSTTALKMDNISQILSNTLNIENEKLDKVVEQIQNTRVTTYKDIIKLKKNSK